MIYSGGFYFPDGDTHFIELGDAVSHYQEPQRLKAFEYVTNWDRAMDMGAHVGIFSRDFAKRFGEVMAFEPTPTTRECLEKNVPENVVILPYACGDREDEVTIQRNPKNSGGSEIVTDETQNPKAKLHHFTVKMIPVDSLNVESLGLVKIDIQGAEPMALRGAEQTLRRCGPVVLIEEKPLGGKHGSTDHIQESHDLLVSFGYEPRELVGADRVFVKT